MGCGPIDTGTPERSRTPLGGFIGHGRWGTRPIQSKAPALPRVLEPGCGFMASPLPELMKGLQQHPGIGRRGEMLDDGSAYVLCHGKVPLGYSSPSYLPTTRSLCPAL